MSEPTLTTWGLLFLIAILGVYHFLRMGRFWWMASATNLGVIYYTVLALVTAGLPGPAEWKLNVAVGVLSFLVGIHSAERLRGVRTRTLAAHYCQLPPDSTQNPRSEHLLLTILVMAWVVVILFLSSFGANELMSVMLESLTDQSGSLNEVRRIAVYGDRDRGYAAPGYVFQFRACLLPAIMLTSFGYYFFVTRRRTWQFLLFVASLIPAALANAAVGQRQALVLPFALLAYIAIVRFYSSERALPPLRGQLMSGLGLVAFLVGGGLFITMSQALGRVQDESPVISGISAFAERLVVIPAETDAQLFELLRDSGHAYGREWLSSLLQPLPNAIEHEIIRDWPQEGTSNWNHAALHGSWEGNAPLDRFGSIWFNFGMPGLILLSALWGFLQHLFDRWCLTWRKTPLTISLWLLASVSLAGSTSPGRLLLTGFAVSLIYVYLDSFVTGIPLCRRAEVFGPLQTCESSHGSLNALHDKARSH